MKKMLFVLSAAAAFAAQAGISDVTIEQRWPWSPTVDISYTLTEDADFLYDIRLEAKNGDAALELPPVSLTGDLTMVAPGARRITLDPAAAGLTNMVMPRFNVKLTATKAPVYLIIDLATGAKTYRYEPGVWAGVNTDEYKTDKLVMKRVKRGTFMMGSASRSLPNVWQAPHPVTLTKDYWLGVFEVTQYQFDKLVNKWPSYFTNVTDRALRPVETVFINDMRGDPRYGSPRFSCSSTSFIGILAARTGLTMDIPTEAQVEYAERSGQSAENYMGITTRAGIEGYARYQSNAGNYAYNTKDTQDLRHIPISTGGTAAVGSYAPNDWGFYDLAGNVWEIAYDSQLYFDTEPMVDPCHDHLDKTKASFIIHGGCFSSNDSWLYSCASRSTTNFAGNWDVGFRVMAEGEP